MTLPLSHWKISSLAFKCCDEDEAKRVKVVSVKITVRSCKNKGPTNFHTLIYALREGDHKVIRMIMGVAIIGSQSAHVSHGRPDRFKLELEEEDIN